MQSFGLIQSLAVCTCDAFFQEYPQAQYPQYAKAIGDAEYVLLAGHRRLAAAREAGLAEVRIDVQDDKAPHMDLVMLEENLKRKGLTVFQEGEGYRRLAEKNDSYASIAKKVGKSKSTIIKRVKLLDLPADAKAAVLAKKLSVDTAYNLMTALDGENLDRLLEAADLMKQGGGITAAEAVNALFSGGSGTTEEPAPQPSPQLSVPAADSGTEPVLTEPAPATSAIATQTAPVPPARTEPVLAEPDAAEEDRQGDAPKAAPTRDNSLDAAKENTGRAQAGAARNEHCQLLVKAHDTPVIDPPSIRIAVTALAHASPAALKRAHLWMQNADAADAKGMEATSYRDALLVRGDATLISRLAYAVALAEDELRASNRSRNWDYRDKAHLRHLIDAGYEPTEWERRRLG